jgi:hypothetical protein
MSTFPKVHLELDEAMELGEILELLERWLKGAEEELAPSFAAFLGAPGYGLSELRVDLRRFAFLLGVAETFYEERQ